MRHKGKIGLGVALLLGAPLIARAQVLPAPTTQAPPVAGQPAAAVAPPPASGGTVYMTQTPAPAGEGTAPGAASGETKELQFASEEGQAKEPSYGPAPPMEAKILQDFIFGKDNKEAPIQVFGWIDADYTYRSTGPGENNIAPVMNRFGDEFLMRQIGIDITKPLDMKTWSWGFNAIFIAGADASFLGPTAGWYDNTNPRFGTQFTDLNLTAHLPILTDGGVDIKAGRQTTCLGPMGALPWQRYFDSSDYAWYNEEEGRYTGISSVWHISKQLDWYNGIEIGGWGVFFDDPAHGVDYLGQLTYWLDEDAKKTKVWTTVLTGPTGFFNDGNSTTWELGGLHNWNKYIYQIVDFQMVYSKAPIFFQPPPGYTEHAYDIYQYLGFHLNTCLDFNTRVEWYRDVDGGGYPGGFGIPNTDYFEGTLGFDWHPNKYLQFRPEIRYDHATNPAFGAAGTQKNQLTIAGDVMFKF
jgi:hypothetical protein